MSQSNEVDNIQIVREIEDLVGDLVRVCLRLREENNALRIKQSVLLAERSDLIGRHEIARTKVESIISRLNEMEHEA